VLSECAQVRAAAALRYRAADGSLTSRDFDVYGLVFRGGRWYVVGFCRLRSGLRTLRLDRVAHAEPTDIAFERPEGFDASEYLSRAMATMPRAVKTEVLLYTDEAGARREHCHMFGVLEPCEGGVLLRGSADELDWYARELMRLPFRFRVKSPQALRDALVTVARAIADEHA
jgi:predicted DNA-binding transcriptional regulator YafY